MTEEMKIPKLKNGVKVFTLGTAEGEELYTSKMRIDKNTIIVLDAVEDNGKIARFTIINDMWTEVSSLTEEEEASLGHITIQVLKITETTARFILK